MVTYNENTAAADRIILITLQAVAADLISFTNTWRYDYYVSNHSTYQTIIKHFFLALFVKIIDIILNCCNITL